MRKYSKGVKVSQESDNSSNVGSEPEPGQEPGSSGASDDSVPIESEGGFFTRPVRTYVIRAGRMTESERRNYEELQQVWCIPFEYRTLPITLEPSNLGTNASNVIPTHENLLSIA